MLTLHLKSIPNNTFNFIRLALASMVAISHFVILGKHEQQAWMTKLFDTEIAIQGFFILSGFLITYSYYRSSSIKDYFKKRALRLLPAYISVVLIAAFFLFFASSYTPSTYFFNANWVKYTISNLGFLNFIKPNLPGVFENNPTNSAVNGSLWTIKIEVLFYLCIPAIIYCCNRIKRVQRINIFLLTIYILSILYSLSMDSLANHYQLPLYNTLKIQLPGQMEYFSIGMLAYYNLEWITKHINLLVVPAALLFLERYLTQTTFLLPSSLCILILFIGFKALKLKKITPKGDYSYGVYIVHYPIAQLFIQYNIGSESFITAFLLYLVAVAIAAALSWHFIEAPFLQRKKAFFNK